MWLFTETGFVSAVAHFEDNDVLMVRARDRESLQGLAKLAGVKISTTPEADYPHRVVVEKTLFQDWVAETITNLNYPNYKSQVAKTRGHDFAAPLHDVWNVMHEVEEGRGKPSRSRRLVFDDETELDYYKV
jgi:hypothetical protein